MILGHSYNVRDYPVVILLQIISAGSGWDPPVSGPVAALPQPRQDSSRITGGGPGGLRESAGPVRAGVEK